MWAVNFCRFPIHFLRLYIVLINQYFFQMLNFLNGIRILDLSICTMIDASYFLELVKVLWTDFVFHPNDLNQLKFLNFRIIQRVQKLDLVSGVNVVKLVVLLLLAAPILHNRLLLNYDPSIIPNSLKLVRWLPPLGLWRLTLVGFRVVLYQNLESDIGDYKGDVVFFFLFGALLNVIQVLHLLNAIFDVWAPWVFRYLCYLTVFKIQILEFIHSKYSYSFSLLVLNILLNREILFFKPSHFIFIILRLGWSKTHWH